MDAQPDLGEVPAADFSTELVETDAPAKSHVINDPIGVGEVVHGLLECCAFGTWLGGLFSWLLSFPSPHFLQPGLLLPGQLGDQLSAVGRHGLLGHLPWLGKNTHWFKVGQVHKSL